MDCADVIREKGREKVAKVKNNAIAEVLLLERME